MTRERPAPGPSRPGVPEVPRAAPRGTIRVVRGDDLVRLHEINQASRPGVGDVTIDAFGALVEAGHLTLVAEVEGVPVGFILCMLEGLDYQSLNYRWVSERYARFAYCDRIAIAAAARGGRLGEALYDEAARRLSSLRDTLICEVNLEPPNPGSLRFHRRLGFVPVSERWNADRSYGVVYLEKRLT